MRPNGDPREASTSENGMRVKRMVRRCRVMRWDSFLQRLRLTERGGDCSMSKVRVTTADCEACEVYS